jgi:hypothetical protein
MADYNDYDEMEAMEQQPPTISFAFIGGDNTSSMTLSQMIRLDQADTFDAQLPLAMLKLRNMLIHAGFSREMVDQFLDVNRIRQLMPQNEVDEMFIDESHRAELEEIRDSDEHSVSNLWEKLPKMGSDDITRVQVDRIDMHNFVFTYSKGERFIELPKSFFDDLIVAQSDADGEEDAGY